MSATTTRALFKDALYQVLDNRVFRILTVVASIFVLLTFVIAAKREEVVILFGWQTLRYEDIFTFFNFPLRELDNANQTVIQVFQNIVVDGLAGTFGVIAAIAATAFFMPQMLEKGAADTVFSKPVSRLKLMLSRYFAGLIFVGLLATFLIGGMHLGLIINSGYSDPGFLWSIPITVYLFGLLHGFSILVGVFTRSTVAAILLTLMFFAFNGCVHNGWRGKEMFLDSRFADLTRIDEAQDGEETPEVEEINNWVWALFYTLDTLHYTMPKTSDAGLIAGSLRKQLEATSEEDYVIDEETQLQVYLPPPDFDRVAPPADAPEALVRWQMAHPEGLDDARVTVRRQPSKNIKRKEVVDPLKAELESNPAVSELEEKKRPRIDGSLTRWLEWSEDRGDSIVFHRHGFFDRRDYIYHIEIEGESVHMEDPEVESALKSCLASFEFTAEERPFDKDPASYFMDQTGWTAPLKYNYWFSIASSIAFVLVTLALAWWRLMRIDF